MKARTKSTLLLVATLIVGGLIGAVTTGAIINQRLDQLQALRSRGGFTTMFEEVIQPTDSTQRVQIRAALERSETRFRDTRQVCRDRFAADRDSMRGDLNGLLTPDQQARLNEWLKRDRDSSRRGRSGPDGRRDRQPRGDPR